MTVVEIKRLVREEREREKNTLFAFCILFVSCTFTNDSYKYTTKVDLRGP